MNTKGHHSIADLAGYDVLDKAFRKLKQRHPKLKFNPKTLRLDAFYLGNWLTDVSQANDPVALATVQSDGHGVLKDCRKWLDDALDNLQNKAASSADNWVILYAFVRRETPEQAYRRVQAVQREVYGWTDEYKSDLRRLYVNEIDRLDAMLKEITKADRIEKVTKAAFKVIGYFKFVHPVKDMNDKKTRAGGNIDYASFKTIIDEQYTQYFPHEHLDRPASKPADTDANTGLYNYMVDDIRVTAGAFAELDVNWAAKHFGGAHEIEDGDVEFNRGLARLGHVIHLVEDFFAHSNFVEHALASLGPDKINWRTVEAEKRGVFFKRLYASPGVPEHYVVTGTFDFVDTFHSLLHAFEEMLGEHESLGIASTVARGKTGFQGTAKEWADGVDKLRENLRKALESASPEKREKIIQGLLRQTLDLVSNPEEALHDRQNLVGKALNEHVVKKIEKVRGRPVDPRLSKDVATDLFNALGLTGTVPTEIRDSFVEVVERMSQVITIGSYAFTLYEAISTLMELVELYKKGPRALAKWLLDRLRVSGVEKLEEILAFYIKQELYDRLGAQRYGSHSLLAKDYGNEPAAQYAAACAAAVHWEIMTVLTRHARSDGYAVARFPKGTKPQKGSGINRIQLRRWVDWERLLFFYLRHPVSAGSATGNFTTDIEHVCGPSDTLASLAVGYGATSDDPAAFNASTIAKANGIPSSFDVHAKLPQGQYLLIPKQSLLAPQPAPSDDAWWQPIIQQKHSKSLAENGWEAIKTRGGWVNHEKQRTELVKYFVPFATKEVLKKDDVLKFARDQDNARKSLERQYNSAAAGP